MQCAPCRTLPALQPASAGHAQPELPASAATFLVLPLGSAGDDHITATQFPTLLHAAPCTGTTGAVLWRVSPLVAGWLCEPSTRSSRGSALLELGCGIAGVTAMALMPRVRRHVCAYQPYGLRQNLAANALGSKRRLERHRTKRRSRRPAVDASSVDDGPFPGVQVLALHWETMSLPSPAARLGENASGVDSVLVCDCNYNSHLVEPFVRTCGENAARPSVACLRCAAAAV